MRGWTKLLSQRKRYNERAKSQPQLYLMFNSSSTIDSIQWVKARNCCSMRKMDKTKESKIHWPDFDYQPSALLTWSIFAASDASITELFFPSAILMCACLSPVKYESTSITRYISEGKRHHNIHLLENRLFRIGPTRLKQWGTWEVTLFKESGFFQMKSLLNDDDVGCSGFPKGNYEVSWVPLEVSFLFPDSENGDLHIRPPWTRVNEFLTGSACVLRNQWINLSLFRMLERF